MDGGVGTVDDLSASQPRLIALFAAVHLEDVEDEVGDRVAVGDLTGPFTRLAGNSKSARPCRVASLWTDVPCSGVSLGEQHDTRT